MGLAMRQRRRHPSNIVNPEAHQRFEKGAVLWIFNHTNLRLTNRHTKLSDFPNGRLNP
jgi:hypothetical protein